MIIFLKNVALVKTLFKLNNILKIVFSNSLR